MPLTTPTLHHIRPKLSTTSSAKDERHKQRSFFRQRTMDCGYWLAIYIWRSFIPFVIRRKIVVARSGGFRGDWWIWVCFSPINLFLSVDRVEFEMAVLKQRKIDGERRVFQDKLTDHYFFIAQKRNSCVFSLFGKNIEYSFSGSSREGHEVSNITLTTNQPPSPAANQLTSSRLQRTPNWLGIGHNAAGGHVNVP